VQGTCGSVYGVVPFVSRRSTGIVCGLVSAGGAVGGVINQAIFFLNTPTKGAYGAHSGLRDARAACRWPCMLGVPGWPICVPSHLADWLVKPAGALCEPVPCKLCVCEDFPLVQLPQIQHVDPPTRPPSAGSALASRPGACALPASLTARARRRAVLAANDAFKWMGCVIVLVACVGVAPLYFPMWGGLFCGPKPGVTEEDYYYSEYTPKEREEGLHLAASNFVRPGARPAGTLVEPSYSCCSVQHRAAIFECAVCTPSAI